ncbi:MAG TPA: NAD(P)-dependent oxidoreductase [Gemmatimonadales bacterium]|nr:NAD(P)-dependent oxidoreductase [Gemmatimonadales bacterium]
MIFVTGGTGLVGRHLLEALRSRGTPARALVRSAASARAVSALGAEPVEGRVEDPALWARIGDCAAVVHAAAMVTARASWSAYQAVNVESARFAAARGRSLGIPVVLISSVAVYGSTGDAGGAESVTEEFPFGPLNDANIYARSKRLGERAFWEGAAGGRAVAFRPCVIYGAGDRQFLPRVIRTARLGFLPMFGSDPQPLALVHSRHIAQAILAALDRNIGWGRAYNLVDPWEMRAPEFITAIGEGLGRRVRTVSIPPRAARLAAAIGDAALGLLPGAFPSKLDGVIRYWRGANPYSAKAAREQLGWAPDVPPRAGIPQAVRSLVAEGLA